VLSVPARQLKWSSTQDSAKYRISVAVLGHPKTANLWPFYAMGAGQSHSPRAHSAGYPVSECNELLASQSVLGHPTLAGRCSCASRPLLQLAEGRSAPCHFRRLSCCLVSVIISCFLSLWLVLSSYASLPPLCFDYGDSGECSLSSAMVLCS